MFRIDRIAKWALFAYIVVFMVTTSVMLNRVCLLVMIAVCGYSLLINARRGLKINLQLICLILYGLMLAISAVYAIAPEDKYTTVLIGYVTMLAVVLFLRDNIRDKRDVDFFLHAVVFGSIIQLFYMLSVYGLDIITVIQESENAIRIGDEVSNSNQVGLSFAYGAVISVHFMRQAIKNKKTSWIFYLAVALVTSVFTLLSGSRKATLVILGGFFCVYLFGTSQSKNVFKKIRTVLVALLLLGLLYWALTSIPLFSVVNDRLEDLIGGLLGNEALDHSSEERFSFIATGWYAFLAHPFIGQGVYSSYQYFGTYSHNNFIEVLMNTGIVGFVIFYIPYVVYSIRILRGSKKDPRFGLMLFLLVWLLFGAYGMVTYYDKMSMSLMMMVTAWIDLNRSEKNEL